MLTLLRWSFWTVLRLLYRVSVTGIENIPASGPALLVANHVSFLDALFIAAHVRRPVSFVMYWRIYNAAPRLFTRLGAVPIASPRENRAIYDAAFETFARLLSEGKLLCIFPEGMLTRTGALNRFRPGARTILDTTPVPVVPIALCGLWGSYFSRHEQGWWKRPHHWMKRVAMIVGDPLEPSTTVRAMEDHIRHILEGHAE